MFVKKIGKTRHVRNNAKCKKYILRGERKVGYYDRILSERQCYFQITI